MRPLPPSSILRRQTSRYLRWPAIVSCYLQPRQFSSATSTGNMARFKTPSSEPPKHEMQFFPRMTTRLPSTSTEFRRVLWTGLYSQLVIMNIPEGGDIGEEVGTSSTWPKTLGLTSVQDTFRRPNTHLHLWYRPRPGRRQGTGGERRGPRHSTSWHPASVHQHRANAFDLVYGVLTGRAQADHCPQQQAGG